MNVTLTTTRKRIFLRYALSQVDDTYLTRTMHLYSPAATHLLAFAMFVLCILGSALQYYHREARRVLRLSHEPGTIASAVALGGKTKLAGLLHSRKTVREMGSALEEKRFGLNVVRHKIETFEKVHERKGSRRGS